MNYNVQCIPKLKVAPGVTRLRLRLRLRLAKAKARLRLAKAKARLRLAKSKAMTMAMGIAGNVQLRPTRPRVVLLI